MFEGRYSIGFVFLIFLLITAVSVIVSWALSDSNLIYVQCRPRRTGKCKHSNKYCQDGNHIFYHGHTAFPTQQQPENKERNPNWKAKKTSEKRQKVNIACLLLGDRRTRPLRQAAANKMRALLQIRKCMLGKSPR
jgi:hypothetical protein